MPSERRASPSISTTNGSAAAAMCDPPCSVPTKIAGRITIEIQTLVPSANATTSANVFQRRSVVSSATASNVQRDCPPRSRCLAASPGRAGFVHDAGHDCRLDNQACDPGAPMTRAHVVVTIDGPAGAGKSSVAKLLARRLGYRVLDSGAIYRAVALTARERGVAWDDGAACAAIA